MLNTKGSNPGLSGKAKYSAQEALNKAINLAKITGKPITTETLLKDKNILALLGYQGDPKKAYSYFTKQMAQSEKVAKRAADDYYKRTGEKKDYKEFLSNNLAAERANPVLRNYFDLSNMAYASNVDAGLIEANTPIDSITKPLPVTPKPTGPTVNDPTKPAVPTTLSPTTPSVSIEPDVTATTTPTEVNPANPSDEGYNAGINLAGEAGKSAAQILAEADLSRQMRQENLAKMKEEQGVSIGKLRQLLEDEAKTKYERELPELYEQLNTRGLLMSSHLGEQMSRRQQESLEDIATQMARQQLGYDASNIGELQRINEGYLGGRGSALQREQSLEDFARQLQASKDLGAIVSPVQPGGSSKSGGSNAIMGGLSGAATGTAIAPGIGTLTGAGLGTLAGFMGGK